MDALWVPYFSRLTFEDGTDSVARYDGNYYSTLRDIPDGEDFNRVIFGKLNFFSI